MLKTDMWCNVLKSDMFGEVLKPFWFKKTMQVLSSEQVGKLLTDQAFEGEVIN